MSKEKVLIIGSGGREHAIGKKIKESSHVQKIYFAQSNSGTQTIGENLKINELDFKNLRDFAKNKKINLTIVGPEEALANGIVNYFMQEKLRIFGPTKWAARLESDKANTKRFLKHNNIPTADFEIFTRANKAKNYLKQTNYPCVIKASGLAAGKGVSICNSLEEAARSIDDIMIQKKFGSAGNVVVIEEFLEGSEFSILALTDGKEIRTLPSAQDYKQAYNNDLGPNTGGMGAYSPHYAFEKDPGLETKIIKEILEPTLNAMKHHPYKFKGCLYLGGMLTADGPKVIEYNVRFGDPESQAVLSLLDSDLYELMSEVADGKLVSGVQTKKGSAVCVVLASRGYPETYQKNLRIYGLPLNIPNVEVYHAGTKKPNLFHYTFGGRVLGVTAVGENREKARELAYKAVKEINTPGGFHYRDDIAKKER